ncbi:MAG: HAMP domain-containing histidine kinase [Patescibacteria group bacterium]|jgi:signal transduction histidine kinase|nr:HAMP domain-containing histidine kinase [Patescibacteria group bacterium]
MESTLKKARRDFTIVTVTVAMLCAILAAFGTYIYAEQRLEQKISASKIGELAQGNSELSAYIANQEPNHAHFETIAGIIQREDQRQITNSLPIVMLIVATVSGVAGWWLSRKLLVPVKDAYLSQRRFMQDAAHELRNPLAAMSTMLQQAENRPPTGKQLSSFITSLGRQATHLSAITTDLLLLEHREYPGKQLVNLSDLLNDILEELHHLAIQRNITIKTNIPDELIAKIDPQHFVYIAKNMLENAIKYSKPNGKPVLVDLKKSKSGWVFSVKDKGIGIPQADIPNITQRFYRASNTAETEGTGLGMAIVAKFVAIYNGDLSIQSAVNKGTTISVKM